jgi:hypothetical protein
MSDIPPAEWPRLSTLSTGLRCRCPRCGKGPLLKGLLTIREACPVCGLDYGFAEPADGPAFFAMSAIGVVGMIAFMAFEFTVQPPIGRGRRAVFLNHPTTPEIREEKQRPSRSRARERARISGCVTLPLGSVAWEGRKALRACRGGSGWSGSSRGPHDRRSSHGGVHPASGPKGVAWVTMPFRTKVPGSSSEGPRRAVAHQ